MNPSRLFLKILSLSLVLLLAGPCLVVAKADDLETAKALNREVEKLYQERHTRKLSPWQKQRYRFEKKSLVLTTWQRDRA